MVRDRAAVRDDRVGRRRLRRVPLLELLPALLRRHEREVERRSRRIQVRDVAEDERRSAALSERRAQRIAYRIVQKFEVVPARGRLERLDHHTAVEQLVTQVWRAEAL